jgi:hypothetical protein
MASLITKCNSCVTVCPIRYRPHINTTSQPNSPRNATIAETTPSAASSRRSSRRAGLTTPTTLHSTYMYPFTCMHACMHRWMYIRWPTFMISIDKQSHNALTRLSPQDSLGLLPNHGTLARSACGAALRKAGHMSRLRRSTCKTSIRWSACQPVVFRCELHFA